MKSMMINRPTPDYGIPGSLLELFPCRLSDAIRREMKFESHGAVCEEIRIRAGRMSCLTLGGRGRRTLPLDVSLSRGEMDDTVTRLCGGSLYAHADTIKQGYISLPGGVRAGICGRAACENGKVLGVSEINGICIRLPHFVKTDAAEVCRLLEEFEYSRGVLVYSPPGEGKTTYLRSAAAELGGGISPKRVAVVDSRGELEFGLRTRGLCIDVLSGYPKAVGIEIALRTLSAQIIICDEIGGDDDVEAIASASRGGAALIASVHASDEKDVMSKKNIKLLIEGGAFGALVGLRRRDDDGKNYTLSVTYTDK